MKTILNFFNDSTCYADHSVHVGMVRLGMVVQAVSISDHPDTKETVLDCFGHIIGFDRAGFGNELILRVEWDNGSHGSIHPSRVKLFC